MYTARLETGGGPGGLLSSEPMGGHFINLRKAFSLPAFTQHRKGERGLKRKRAENRISCTSARAHTSDRLAQMSSSADTEPTRHRGQVARPYRLLMFHLPLGPLSTYILLLFRACLFSCFLVPSEKGETTMHEDTVKCENQLRRAGDCGWSSAGGCSLNTHEALGSARSTM